jgi:endonuclease-3
MTIKQKYEGIISWFEQNMAQAETELNYRNGYELLVAVILSAQCTDKRVNMVTPALFEKLPTAEAMATASIEDIYSLIKSISYPNNKAKNLSAMARKLVDEFNGLLPQDLELLQELPGVGRKTANVIGAVLWDMNVMPVDTHVFRVSARIGLTKNAKTPLQCEEQLTKHFPKNLLSKAHHWLILHGRYVCTARAPHCNECGIKDYCDYFFKNNK